MPVRWNPDPVTQRVRRGIRRGIVRGTEALRNEVISQVLDTPKTGRIYARRGVEHQASAPGEPPASDTGALVRSIRTDYARIEAGVGSVVASAAHAPALEYGTERMEPRPFMRPAVARARDAVVRMVADEIIGELER